MIKRILIVTTNYSGINNKNNSSLTNTGVWLEEFAVPYLVFKETGYDTTVASPKGGLSPIDENSMSCSNPEEWDECIKKLRDTEKLLSVNYTDYDVLYLPGGHGPMFDLAGNTLLQEIVEYFYNHSKIIAAICHGVAGLTQATDKNGDSILKNKKVTSFTNREEEILKLQDEVPFLLETKLKSLGVDFENGEPWSEHVCDFHGIITGQNQQSSLLLAETIVKYLDSQSDEYIQEENIMGKPNKMCDDDN